MDLMLTPQTLRAMSGRKEKMIEEYRRLDYIPFDRRFWVDGNEELCHATGYEVKIDGQWWNEYVDYNEVFHYGR